MASESNLYIPPEVMRPHLRQCAARVAAFGVGLKTGFSDNARKVAEAYLAEHPQDEDEPADIDWLNNLSRVGGDMSFLAIMLVDKEIRLLSPCTKEKPEYVAPRAVTKGDVRKLCQALGVMLIEPTN